MTFTYAAAVILASHGHDVKVPRGMMVTVSRRYLAYGAMVAVGANPAMVTDAISKAARYDKPPQVGYADTDGFAAATGGSRLGSASRQQRYSNWRTSPRSAREHARTWSD